MEVKSLYKNMLFSNIYQILLVVLPFITAPYVARVLKADGEGIYSFTHSVQMIFSIFASLGTQVYGAREIARNRDDSKMRSLLFWEIELLSILTSTITIIAWSFFVCFSSKYQLCYLIFTGNLLATMIDISWFYVGIEKFKHIVCQQTLFKILGVAAIFLFVKKSSDIYIYILIMVMTTILGNLGMWCYLKKYIVKVSIKNVRIFRHLKETLIYFFPTVATSIYTILDKTLLGYIVNSEAENGYYEQVTKIINIAKSVTFAGVNSVMGSRISYLFAQNEYSEIRKKINQSINYILFMGIAICCGLIAVSTKFVPIFFGAGYDKVILLIRIASPLVLIIGVSNCLGAQYYNPAGKRSLSTKFIILGSFVNLFLNLFLIPRYYSVGAICATIVAEIVIACLYLFNCNSMLCVSDVAKMSYKKIIVGIVMLVAVYWIGMLPLNEFFVLLLQIASGVIIYIGLLYILKDSFVYDIVKKFVKKEKG